jgi:dihydrofolate reductase
MGSFLQSVDTVLWGRKTYEQLVVKRGTTGLRGDLKHYLFSRKRLGTPFSGFEYVKQPVKVFAQGLRTSPGRNIWIIGGGGLIASFLDEGEIDEFRLQVIPIFLGSGIPLLEPRHRSIPLELGTVRKFSDSVLGLQYTVVKTAY